MNKNVNIVEERISAEEYIDFLLVICNRFGSR